MKKVLILCSFLVLTGLTHRQNSRTMAQNSSAMPAEKRQEFVTQYCAGCHNDRMKSGDFSFASMDLTNPHKTAERAERVILKLRAGMMPPAGSRRPDAETVKSFVSTLENSIDTAAAADPNPGRPALFRLNRTEYRNSLRDMLDMDVAVENLLPPDNMSYGFDNIADVLTSNTTLMEAYVRAAGKVSRMAVGDPTMSPTAEPYKMPTTFSQLRHVEGTPFGTRGGTAITHNFPADGEYVFRMSLYFTRNTFLFGSTGDGEKLEVTVNGERVALFDIDPLMMAGDNDLRTPPVHVKAGPQKVTASFITKADGPIDDLVHQPERSLRDDFLGQAMGVTTLVHLQDFVIQGPYNASGVSDTASRRKVFICRPTNPSEEEACASKILGNLAQQAFRRPLTSEHSEELMAVYNDGRSGGNFESGIRLGLQFILANPEFVFRLERAPSTVSAKGDYAISDLELASRLSHFLWSSAPDAALLAVARTNKLRDPGVLEREVQRMLQDPKSEALATNFAVQWLHLRNLKDALPDVYLYPDSDENLFRAMRRETELFFDSMVRENRGILDLLTRNETFVNERLAKHYKIPNILGERFRRVTLSDENRFGLLGQAGVLTVTSFSNRTSPVARGKWVLEQILGVPAPVPPPNVPDLEENNVVGGDVVRLRTVRERLEKHRSSEPCSSCHKIMDPLGMALENFDAIGSWREQDSGYPIDGSGELVDGTKLNNPVSLRQALLKYEGSVVRNFIVKLTTYALGRGVSFADMPFIRANERQASKDGYRFKSIVMGIVQSPLFQRKAVEGRSTAAERN